ncbi:DsbA family protein [Actinocrispum sp. NPDC049592]|uniref:2-hydroxychromene-2-carboxylate isomerase n=1 Tax=Actinocrispum sp. NPDC049592 TaxID=3154835 RepID=UPI003440D159
MARKREPRFYFSLRSPYSWLAYRELLDKYADVASAVEWVPFWEPDSRSAELLAELGGKFPYSAMSRAKHLYILQDVGRIAEARQATLTWPVDRDPVWEIPHLGYLVAREQGRGAEYIALAYQARWEQGRNICDPVVVADIATALGLSPDEVTGASEDPVRRKEGAGILLEICRDGVFGVPFFVHGFSRFWGLDRLAEFADHLRAEMVPAESMPSSSEPLGVSGDQGHAGGCG